jgi:hypothetical protein
VIRRRFWIPCSFTLALGVGACGGSASVAPIAAAPEKEPRRPEGVVLEPQFTPPEPQERAFASGIVTLRRATATSEVESFVRRVLDACVAESLPELSSLLAADAPFFVGPRSTVAALDIFRQRLRTFDYGKLRGIALARWDDAEVLREDELSGRRAPILSDPRFPVLQPGDVYVHVPIDLPRVVSEPLFGDAVWFLLRRSGDRLVAVAAGEDPR